MATGEGSGAGYHRQHLFTSSLLSRWCDDRPGEPKRVLELSRATPDRPKTVVPRRTGYFIDFIDEDRQHFESKWSSIEDAAITALRSLDVRTHARATEAEQHAIVDLLALHVVRGHGTRTYWEAAHRRVAPRRLAAIADGPAVREAAAVAGIEPIEFAAALTHGWDDPLRHGGRAFGEILVELLTTVSSTLRAWGFTVTSPIGGDVIAPDVACVTVDDQRGAVGVLGGVGLNSATTLLMPVGPGQLIVLRPRDSHLVNREVVRNDAVFINELLARAAIQRVWARPGGISSAQIAEIWRTQTDPPPILER